MSIRTIIVGCIFFSFVSVGVGQDKDEPLWRNRPTIVGIGLALVEKHFESNTQPGPVGPIITQYILNQVLVDRVTDPDFGQPGFIDEITTFFEDTKPDGSPVDFSVLPGATQDPETLFYQIPGTARFSYTVEKDMGLPNSTSMPMTPYDPMDEGIEVPAMFIHNTDEDWVEVRASGLSDILGADMLEIPSGTCVYVGLTPRFIGSIDTAPFSGDHITHDAPLNKEGTSARLQADPDVPAVDWVDTGVYATMEIRGASDPTGGSSDFFFSTAGLNAGTTNNSSLLLTPSIGDAGSLYIYVDGTFNADAGGVGEGGIDTGVLLDVATSNPGVIAFTGAKTFDFDIALTIDSSVVIGPRWGDAFGPAGALTADAIIGLDAFTVVAGDGILTSNTGTGPFLDLGYDVGANAFLFACIGWEVVGTGTTEILIDELTDEVVHDGMQLEPDFGSATFFVSPALPEVLGDINGDGLVTLLDVQPLIDLIVSGEYEGEGDVNQDGVVDLMDIAPFISLLQGN